MSTASLLTPMKVLKQGTELADIEDRISQSDPNVKRQKKMSAALLLTPMKVLKQVSCSLTSRIGYHKTIQMSSQIKQGKIFEICNNSAF